MTSPRGNPETEAPDLATRIARIAHAMTHGALGPGDLAELRRLDVNAPDRPTYWKILVHHLGLGTDDPAVTPGSERAWAIILSNMARMAPSPHNPRRPLGHALFDAGFPEQRLLRLLRSSGTTFVDTLRRACGFLAREGIAVNWVEVARLVLTRDPDQAEEIRRKIARDFFAATV
jgi:CRISPR system Cascade subunit CasB